MTTTDTYSPTAEYRLSRFVCIRPNGTTLQLESPFSSATLPLAQPVLLRMVSVLAEGVYPSDLLENCPPKNRDTVDKLLRRFHQLAWLVRVGEPDRAAAPTVHAAGDGQAGTLPTPPSTPASPRTPVSEAASIPKPDDDAASPALPLWEYHDLLYHTRSRAGRHANRIGAVPSAAPSESALRPAFDGPSIDLYTPDLEAVAASDRSFTDVLESRRSIRQYDGTLTVQQLGEFLYRTARCSGPSTGTVSRRLYPSGGGLYPLEIYPVVREVDGLDDGCYHYRPDTHQLTHVSDRTPAVDQLLIDARIAAGLDEEPPVLFCISARFLRLFWKYRSIAYSLIQKEVGGLYQTMWLVATAMNLAPCGLGSGNSDLFTAIIDTDYYTETSVGEFILGPRATD